MENWNPVPGILGARTGAAQLSRARSDRCPNACFTTDCSRASSVTSHSCGIVDAASDAAAAYDAEFMAAARHGKNSADLGEAGYGHTSRRRVGLFGGTFDPPHIGHLVVAETVRDALELDEMRLVVANEPWQKTPDRQITDARLRLEMIQAALGDAPGLVASAVEIERGGPSYTIDTLEAFEKAETETDWLLVVGADAAAGLDTWHRSAELAELAEIVVVGRAGIDPSDQAVVPPGWRWSAVEIPTIGISSTAIRANVARGRSIRFLTPSAVVSIIDRAGLYQ